MFISSPLTASSLHSLNSPMPFLLSLFSTDLNQSLLQPIFLFLLCPTALLLLKYTLSFRHTSIFSTLKLLFLINTYAHFLICILTKFLISTIPYLHLHSPISSFFLFFFISNKKTHLIVIIIKCLFYIQLKE